MNHGLPRREVRVPGVIVPQGTSQRLFWPLFTNKIVQKGHGISQAVKSRKPRHAKERHASPELHGADPRHMAVLILHSVEHLFGIPLFQKISSPLFPAIGAADVHEGLGDHLVNFLPGDPEKIVRSPFHILSGRPSRFGVPWKSGVKPLLPTLADNGIFYSERTVATPHIGQPPQATPGVPGLGGFVPVNIIGLVHIS